MRPLRQDQPDPAGAGDTVLVHAGAGGVGLILTQWAHLLGALAIDSAIGLPTLL
ncbi:hypothetical protein MAHJHV60_46110 [Mycobacterium avium subsp. hominissuis]